MSTVKTMTTVNEHRCMRAKGVTGAVLAVILTALFTAGPCGAAVRNHLSAGIRLYLGGYYDEALYEFKTEIDANPYCPLAYYYAALIRIKKEQYSRAKTNLEEALRDSSDFHDARGLLAFALQKMGRNTEALAEWKQFAAAVRQAENGSDMTDTAIMLPDEYHKKLAQEAEEQRRKQLAEEQRTREREGAARQKQVGEASERTAPGQSGSSAEGVAGLFGMNESDSARSASYVSGGAATDTAGIPGKGLSAAKADTAGAGGMNIPLGDIDRRVRSGIRKGLYGMLALTAALALGVFGVVKLIKRRRKHGEEVNFSEEVERLMNDKAFEHDEEKAIKEFEAKKRELLETLHASEEKPAPAVTEEHYPEEPEPELHEIPIPETMRKSHITEEVKALVSRLHREGHSAAEIANNADLTKTEVDLILAVREHYLENLIGEFESVEDTPDDDQLLRAVYSLNAEGASIREIAQKLNISTSEVRLASKMLEMRKRGY